MSANRNTTWTFTADASQAGGEIDRNLSAKYKEAATAATQSAAAQTTANQASAQSAQQVAAATRILTQEINNNKTAVSLLRVAIADNRAEAVNLGIAMRVLEDQGRKNSAEYDALAQRLRIVKDETAQLSATQAQLTASSGLATQQLNTMAPAGGSAAQAIRLIGAESRLLGGHLQGLARPLAMIVNGLGTMTGAQIAWIAGIGIAIVAISRLISAKKELIEVDEKQVALNIASAQTGGSQQRVMADVISSIRNVAGETESYQKNTRELNKSLDDLIIKGGTSYFTFNSFGKQVEVVRNDTEHLQSTIGKLNDKIAEQDKTMKPAIESLKLLQRSYGLNEEGLISLATQLRLFNLDTERGQKDLEFFKQQLDADLPGLESLASALKKDTDRMYDLRRAALETALAVQQIKPPNLNLGAFQTPSQQNDRLRQAKATAVKAADELGQHLSDDEIFNRIRPELEAVRKLFLDNAAALGKNQAETKALFNSYVSQLDPMYQQWIARLATVAKNERVFTDEKNAGAKAAREIVANEDALFNLRKELIASEEKLDKFNFEKQRDLIHQEFAERRKVAADQAAQRHASIADQAAINSILIELEHNMILISQKMEAEHTIKLKEEYSKRLDAGRKFRAIEQKEILNFMVKQRTDREAMQAKAMAEQDKLDRIARSDRPGRKAAEVEAYAKEAADINRVATAFGFASKNAHVFQLQLQALDKFNDGDFFGGLKDSFHALADEMRASQSEGERWSSFLQSAVSQLGSNIEQGFEGIINGTTTFGQLMKKLMFDLIASLASQWGAYYLAIGFADLFWNPAQGAAEIAAGTALLALAGVLHALGSSASAKTGAGAAATASSSSSASSPTRAAKPPIDVPVATTPGARNIFGPSSSGGDSITVYLESPDDNGMVNYLDGKGVVFKGKLRRDRRELRGKLGIV